VEDQFSKANQALVERDSGLAELVIVSDQKVNVLQQEIEEFGVRILATRQPVARDLKVVIAGYAANVARHIPDFDTDYFWMTISLRRQKRPTIILTNII